MVWLGAGGLILGLAGTLPTAATAVSQVVAARVVAGARGARAFIAKTWLLQALALAVVGCFALLPRYPALPLVCGGAIVAWFLGGLSVPAWTSLVSRTVPRPQHGWFFGLRGAAQQAGVVSAILGGGALLSATNSVGRASLGFLLVFGLAGVFRAVGTGLLLGVPERSRSHQLPPLGALFITLKVSSEFRRLALYLWTLHFATWVAAPFFLPYMLRDLGLGYREVGLLIAVPAIVKILTMRSWGRLADRVGPGPLLRSMGWCVLPVSAMWLLSDNVWWIAFAQLYAGLAWGAFELAQASALLLTTRGREGTIALFNLVDGGAMILGSVVGGLIVMGADRVIGTGFLAAIAVSTIFRALAAVLLLPRVRRIGMPEWSHRKIPLRLWGVRAARGATFRPWADLPPANDQSELWHRRDNTRAHHPAATLRRASARRISRLRSL
jgi:MFS family permease